MNNILVFISLFLGLIGFLGGIGYMLYIGQWVVAIGVFVLGVYAYPMMREKFNTNQVLFSATSSKFSSKER